MKIGQKLIMYLRQALLALLWVPCMLAAQPVQENMIKAAFVYNFVLFTEWPQEVSQGSESINICVNAASDVEEALRVLNSKSAKGQRLKVIQKKALDQGLNQCHVLYIDRLDRAHWQSIKNAIADNRILTISDDAEIGSSGAMIVLELSENKMVFDIDQGTARKAHLLFSSKLLRLARTVR